MFIIGLANSLVANRRVASIAQCTPISAICVVTLALEGASFLVTYVSRAVVFRIANVTQIAFLDVFRTVFPLPSGYAGAIEVVDEVGACSTVLARNGMTVVDIVVAICTVVACFTRA